MLNFFFFFSSRRRHTRFDCDWSSDVCSSDLDVLRVDRLRADPVTEAGVRVQVDQRDGERAGDADLATRRAGDDGDDAVLRGRGDRDVLRGVHDRAAADVRVGEDLDEVDTRT